MRGTVREGGSAYQVIKLDLGVHVGEDLLLEILGDHEEGLTLVVPSSQNFFHHSLANVAALHTLEEGVGVRFLVCFVQISHFNLFLIE